MNNLDIQLIVNPSCELVAIDRTSYNNLQYEFAGELEFLQDRSQHVSIEFLCDRDNNVISDSINLEDGLRNRCELLDGNTSVFHFPYDGTFTYYKFLVPHVMHLLKRNSSNEEVFYINGETFFYSGHFYYNNKFDSVELRDFISLEEAIKFIVDNSIMLELNELWTYQGTQTFSYQKNIFSVCKLQKCLVNLQKQIMSDPKNCKCDYNSSLKMKRDFLLSSLYVFDFLKDRQNFEEAQRILDNLGGCSDEICGDNNIKSDCGCGNIVF